MSHCIHVLVRVVITAVLVSFTPPAHGSLSITKATWYGEEFHGKLMANGQPFNMHDPTTAAHRDLPLGATLSVKNKENGREHIVRIKDRMPYNPKDPTVVLDLSLAAAAELDFVSRGKVEVAITVLNLPPTSR